MEMLVDEFNFKDEPPLVGVMGALGVGLVQGATKRLTTQPRRTVRALGRGMGSVVPRV